MQHFCSFILLLNSISLFIAKAVMSSLRDRYKRGRQFQLTAEEAVELVLADNSDDEAASIDESDIDTLEEADEAGETSFVNIIAGECDSEDNASIESDTVAAFDTSNTYCQLKWTAQGKPPVVPTFSKPLEHGRLSKRLDPIDLDPYNVYMEVSNMLGLVNIIVEESNRYANQKGEVFETNSDEIRAFLGICLCAGYHVLPSLRDYWSTDPDLGVAFISKIMTRNRFAKIRSLIRFNNKATELPITDPNRDRACKVRPVFEHLNKAFQNAMAAEKQQSIDERMIKFKGHNVMKQYIRSKPIKWGFKVWVRAGARSGYVYQMEPYVGKESTRSGLGLGESVICKLSESLIQSGCELYFDNLFTSPRALLTLADHGLLATGTVRQMRKGLPPLVKSDSSMKKGDILSYQTTDRRLNYMKWCDTKPVCLLSNYLSSVQTVSKARKKKGHSERIETDIPLMVTEYNKYMGGVDKSDQMKSAYAFDHRSKQKYYLRIFHDLMDTTVVNGFIIYNKILERHGQKKMTHLEFQQCITRGLTRNYTSRSFPVATPGSRKRARTECGDHTHLPTFLDERKRCVVCTKKKLDNRTDVYCEDCNVCLCLQKKRNCFKVYHS